MVVEMHVDVLHQGLRVASQMDQSTGFEPETLELRRADKSYLAECGPFYGRVSLQAQLSLMRLQMAALSRLRYYFERDSNPGPWDGWKFLPVPGKIMSTSEVWDQVKFKMHTRNQ